GVTSLTVECWGAGGKGSNSFTNGTGRGGGGGGAYARSTFAVVPGGNASNQHGGDTYFGANIVRAQGGRGLTVDVTNGALGGSAENSVGQVKYNGGNGGNASGVNSGGGGGGAGSTGPGNNASGRTGGAARSDNGGSGGSGGQATCIVVCLAGYGTVGNNYGGGGGGSAAGTLSGILQLA